MSTLNAEWLNQNSQRAYPFQEDALRRPRVDGVLLGAYAIPNGLLLDLVMATNFDEQPRVYVSSLTMSGSLVALALADASDGTVLASVSAPVSDDGIVPVNFTGVGKHDDIRGTAVFGNLARVVERLPDGVYSFDAAETSLEARCVRPSIPCVSGLFITDTAGAAESFRLRGDVALVAGQNIRLDFSERDNAIIINADGRYGFNDTCDCEVADRRTQIRTVNGISVADLVIEGGDCVSVEQKGPGRIVITDTCSKPCCGCAELTFLNQKTNEITTTIGKLEQFSQELSGKLDNFINNVLLSNRSLSQYI